MTDRSPGRRLGKQWLGNDIIGGNVDEIKHELGAKIVEL